MNNSSNTSTYLIDYEDFWEPMFGWNKATILSLITGGITLMQIPLMINVYHFNNNKHYKTILHSFECFFIVILISYLACSHYMAYARLIFGPLPKFFCVMESFGMNSISVAGLLTADCLIITRYLYTFVIKNWALVKEDLLLTFIRFSIILISIMIGILHFLSPGKHSTSYYICLGEDPGIDPYDHGKVPWAIIVYLLSMIVYPIFFFKTSFKSVTPLVNQPQMDKSSTLDLFAFISGVLIVVIDAIVWRSYNKLDIENMRSQDNLIRWAPFMHRHLSFDCLIFIFCLRIYVKRPKLIKDLWKNLRT